MSLLVDPVGQLIGEAELDRSGFCVEKDIFERLSVFLLSLNVAIVEVLEEVEVKWESSGQWLVAKRLGRFGSSQS